MTGVMHWGIVFYIMARGVWVFVLLLTGCVSDWRAPDDFVYRSILAGRYEIATWQKINDSKSPIHIYLEGDGYAFNGRGVPTDDPTPRGTFLRNLATSDNALNVVYMARPCQYTMPPTCSQSDWTDGRFSSDIVDSVSSAIKAVANNRPIILIGYSGGAMLSGLVIKNHPEINVAKWITIAGVLNHSDWTEYFGDSPLVSSMNLDELPHLPQVHYVAQDDKTVPIELTKKWTGGKNMIIVPNSTHSKFEQIELDFTY